MAWFIDTYMSRPVVESIYLLLLWCSVLYPLDAIYAFVCTGYYWKYVLLLWHLFIVSAKNSIYIYVYILNIIQPLPDASEYWELSIQCQWFPYCYAFVLQNSVTAKIALGYFLKYLLFSKPKWNSLSPYGKYPYSPLCLYIRALCNRGELMNNHFVAMGAAILCFHILGKALCRRTMRLPRAIKTSWSIYIKCIVQLPHKLQCLNKYDALYSGR